MFSTIGFWLFPQPVTWPHFADLIWFTVYLLFSSLFICLCSRHSVRLPFWWKSYQLSRPSSMPPRSPPPYLLSTKRTHVSSLPTFSMTLVGLTMPELTVICFVLDLYICMWYHLHWTMSSKMSGTFPFLICSAWQRDIHFIYVQKVITFTEFFKTSILPNIYEQDIYHNAYNFNLGKSELK